MANRPALAQSHAVKYRLHAYLPRGLTILLIVYIALVATTSGLSLFLRNAHASTPKVSQAIVPAPAAKPPTTNPAPAATPAPAPRIEAYTTGLQADPQLQKILDAYNAVTPPNGLVVLDITDKTYAAVEPDQVRTAASLYKLFVARELYDFKAKGKLSFDQTMTVTQTAANQDDTNVNDYSVGSSISIADCLQRMIVISDNTCGYLLGGLIGWNNANDTLHVRGYSQTSLGTDQLTSAGDVGLLLRRMAEGQMVDEASSRDLEALLFQQQVNDRLPALLPAGVIGHKTGNLGSLVHDAGLVRSQGKSYVIVVMSGPWGSTGTDAANSAIAGLSRQVYDYILNYNPKP